MKQFVIGVCPFPFISVYNDRTIAHESPSFIAGKELMLAEFESWENEAKKLIETKNDLNAKTFMTSGNFDQIGARIEAWQPYPMFVFYDHSGLNIEAFAMIQPEICEEDQKLFAAITTFAVNPKYYGTGIGTRCIKRLLQDHQSSDVIPKLNGMIILSELSAVPFWEKMGFVEFESEKIYTKLDDVKKMKIIFTF